VDPRLLRDRVIWSLHRRVHLDDARAELLRVGPQIFKIRIHDGGLQKNDGNEKGRLVTDQVPFAHSFRTRRCVTQCVQGLGDQQEQMCKSKLNAN
jgi:hypothetical protein